MVRLLRIVLAIIVSLILNACASLPVDDPVQVTVADIEPLPGEGLEMRMMVKLRVQNPNDKPVEYSGVFLRLDVQDRTFATGVSDERGNVPRYGQSIINVPVTVSALRVAGQALSLFSGGPVDKFSYKMHGKLDGPGFGSTRFQAQGEFALSAARP